MTHWFNTIYIEICSDETGVSGENYGRLPRGERGSLIGKVRRWFCLSRREGVSDGYRHTGRKRETYSSYKVRMEEVPCRSVSQGRGIVSEEKPLVQGNSRFSGCSTDLSFLTK